MKNKYVSFLLISFRLFRYLFIHNQIPSLPDLTPVASKVQAWTETRNQSNQPVDWRFTTEDAWIKLKRFYPILFRFSIAWYEAHIQRVRATDMEPAMESHLLKFGSLVPSLALLIHLADHPQRGPVGAGALKAAIAWAVYLGSHARRLYASVTAPEMVAATALDKRLPDLEDGFTASNISRRGWAHLTRETTPGALAILEDHFRIRGHPSKGKGGGPPLSTG